MIDVPYAVKRALKDGNRPKQYRFQVLNDDETVDFTIDNDTLVKESVKIDERMCSGDRLKFGLCEGASIEFQYFNHPNIRGRRVKVYLDVAYDNEGTEAYYPLSMGYFDIDQCSTQFSTGIIKAVAYNKLRSAYLDQKCNDAIIEAATTGDYGRTDGTSIGSLLQNALEGYSIEPEFEVKDCRSNAGLTSLGVLRDDDFVRPLYTKNPDGTYSLINGATSERYDETIWAWPVTVYGSISPMLTLSNDKYYRVSAKAQRIYEIYQDGIAQSQCADLYVRTSNNEYVKAADYYATVGANTSVLFYCDSNATSYGDEAHNYVLQEGGDPSEMPAIKKTPYLYKTQTNETVFGYADFPIYIVIDTFADDNTLVVYNRHTNEIQPFLDRIRALLGDDDEQLFYVEERVDTDADEITFTKAQAEALPDVTLRELQSAVFETSALYGQLDRETDLFYGVELNSGSLTPSATLYPSTALYPNQGYGNNIFRPFPSEYQKLWTDSVGEQTFRYLIITYKAIEYDQQGNPTEVDKTLQRTVHEHGTTNYNCSDNWLFRNLVWTAEQVGAYADAMVEKMLNIRWFPFEMWSTGLPYVEVGDAIEIADKEGDTHISYVLQRQLNGIQNLQDTYINGQLDIF